MAIVHTVVDERTVTESIYEGQRWQFCQTVVAECTYETIYGSSYVSTVVLLFGVRPEQWQNRHDLADCICVWTVAMATLSYYNLSTLHVSVDSGDGGTVMMEYAVYRYGPQRW